MHKEPTVTGWDVGGAHLKAVSVDADGVAIAVIQVQCPLWRGLDELHKAMDDVLGKLGSLSGRHAVTMTGELADVFTDRSQGVMQISDVMTARLGVDTHFYAGASGMVGSNNVASQADAIASANWQASATFIAAKVGQGILADVGSTTTDIVLLSGGKPCNQGISDSERMRFEELVYTGVVRTPLMALGSHIQFNGEWCGLAAEYFATTADVYRITGDLRDSEDMGETADNTGKTFRESARRLARMIGHDFYDASEAAWIGLARAFKQQQLIRLEDAVFRCLSRGLIADDAPFIGTGAGSFLVRELAGRMGRSYVDAETLITARTPELRRWASICLPAYAMAHMQVKNK